MGCSSSNVVKEQDKQIQKLILTDMIKREWKIYADINLKIESLLNDVNSKFRDDFTELMDSVLFEETFFNRYYKLLTQYKLTPKDIQNYMLDIELIANMCKENYLEYEIHNIIVDCQEKLFPALSDKNKNELKTLLKNNERIFPNLQKGIYFQVKDINKTNEQLRYCRILKYNDKYNNMSVLTVKMKSDLKNYMVLEEASEIICCNVTLITVVLFLQFEEKFNLDLEDYRIFFECFVLFLENVKIHKNLKTFVLVFEDNNSYALNSPFYNNLFDIIIKNTIMALVIVGVTLNSQDLQQKLIGSLNFNKSLQFLMLHFIEPIEEMVNDLCEALSENRGLKIFCMSGGKVSPEQVKKIYSKLKHLKVFNYKSDFFIV
jgi:nucleoside diphosphate kinase